MLSNTDQPREFLVSSSWGESAIISDKATLLFSTESYNIGTFEIRDINYDLIANSQYTAVFKPSEVAKVMSDMGRFLK